jgi:hypothetical protein
MIEEISIRKKIFRDTFDLEIPLQSKLRLSKGLFKNKKAFIFAAGPSLSTVDVEKLTPHLRDNLVICVKQSIDVVGDQSDLLLMNFCNFNTYDWGDINCPVVWTTFDASHSEIIENRGLKSNALFPVVENLTNDLIGLSSSTAGKESWDNLLRLPEERAIWGPGLMYELAIPFALHCGVEHITLVGWDIGTLRENSGDAFLNEHFYDNSKVEMKTKITSLEIGLVSKSTKSLKIWLAKKGVSISVVADVSIVDESIERERKWLKEKV